MHYRTMPELVRINRLATGGFLAIGFVMIGFMLAVCWADDVFDLDPSVRIERAVYVGRR